MKYLIIILAFASCTTQRKAEEYFNTHTKDAALYCSVKFPPRDSVIVRVDTVELESDITDLMNYADSVAQVAKERDDAVQDAMKEVNDAILAKDYTEARYLKIKQQLDAYKPPDIPALRKSIELELRKTLQPCKDSIVYRENTAKAAYYGILEAEYNKFKEEKKMPGKVFGWLMVALARQWWFWVAAAAIIWWIVWRIRAGALNKVLSKFK